MKTILEITLSGKTEYSGPGEIMNGVIVALHKRLFKSVRSAVDFLPKEMKSQIKERELPKEIGSLKDLNPSLIILDEHRPLSKDELDVLSNPQA